MRITNVLPMRNNALPLHPGHHQNQVLTGVSWCTAADTCTYIAHYALGRTGEVVSCFCVQVVDNSSAFRMTEGVPLVIPEVNPEAMKGMRYGQGGIIANPNCSTIIALMAVTPLHKAAKVQCLCFMLHAASCMTNKLMLQLTVCGHLQHHTGRAARMVVFCYCWHA